MDNILDFINNVDGPVDFVTIVGGPVYGYTLTDINVTLIKKVTISTNRLVFTAFEIQDIDLKTRKITESISPFFDDALNIINDEAHYKVEKLTKFLNLIKDNKEAFDSTINSIITALKS